ASGLHYTFIKTGAAGNVGSIIAGLNLIKGVVLRADASVDVAAAGDSRIIFSANAAAGDTVNIYCNGTAWTYPPTVIPDSHSLPLKFKFDIMTLKLIILHVIINVWNY